MNVSADSASPSWVTRALHTSIHARVRRDSRVLDNRPLIGSEDLIAGRKIYLNDCVGCHGETGKPSSDFGATFYPPAPQFPLVGTEYDLKQVFWVAKHGIRRTGMASQKFSYSDKELWLIAAFIKSVSDLPPEVHNTTSLGKLVGSSK